MIFKGRGNSTKECHVNVNGTRVWNVEQATHLGHCLSTNDPDTCSSVGGANAQFWRSFNILKSDFGHINSTLQCRLFKQHCHRRTAHGAEGGCSPRNQVIFGQNHLIFVQAMEKHIRASLQPP